LSTDRNALELQLTLDQDFIPNIGKGLVSHYPDCARGILEFISTACQKWGTGCHLTLEKNTSGILILLDIADFRDIPTNIADIDPTNAKEAELPQLTSPPPKSKKQKGKK
jgi:hypothetical protein